VGAIELSLFRDERTVSANRRLLLHRSNGEPNVSLGCFSCSPSDLIARLEVSDSRPAEHQDEGARGRYRLDLTRNDHLLFRVFPTHHNRQSLLILRMPPPRS
jgi:hypothetical protein